MRFIWTKYKYIGLTFLSIFGPATISAIADNDAAGVATYSLAGAKFGYSILFILIYITILLAFTQEMGVRIAVITGKGLGDLIRERHGIKISIIVFLMLFIANLGSIIANFSGLKIVAEMFSIPSIPLIIFIIIASFLFISKGSYQTNQRIFLLGSILYVAYIFSAVKANPNWGEAVQSLIIPPQLKLSTEFILASVAVLGTTITPWGQFFINSFVVDKKVQPDKLRYSQMETYFGAFLTDFFSFFMIVATASTLFVHGINLTSGEQAALAIRPFAGELASFLFGFGLLNAAVMGIIIIALTTAYAFSEFFGYEGSLDAPFERGKLFYGLFLMQLIIAGVIVLFPFASLFNIVFYTQSINAILLPVIFYFLLKITNNRDLMGNFVNNKFYNYFAVFSSAIIIFSTLFVLISSLL